MTKIKKHKFSELYDFSSGISSKPEQSGHGSPFLSFSTVFNNYFVPKQLPDLMDSSEEEQKKYSILKGDIFLTRTSETVDELGMSCVSTRNYPKATYSGFLKRLRPLPSQTSVTYPKYMAFYLRSKFFRKTMENNSCLTLRASLNEQIFSYLELFLPDYDYQVKTGDFLYLLNKKIELNNRINEELEKMTKALYDYWFVQFDFPNANGKPYKSSGGIMVWNEELKKEIPEGWSNGVLSDIANITMGQSPPGSSYNNDKDGTIFFQGCTDFGRHFPVTRQYTTDPKRYAKAGDILLSVRAPVGSMNIAQEDCCIGRGLASLSSKDGCIAYLFGVMTYFKQVFDSRNASGTTFGSITKDDLFSLKVLKPNKEILEAYNKITFPAFQLQNSLELESRELSELRDWLLPMLMNGQVSVS